MAGIVFNECCILHACRLYHLSRYGGDVPIFRVGSSLRLRDLPAMLKYFLHGLGQSVPLNYMADKVR